MQLLHLYKPLHSFIFGLKQQLSHIGPSLDEIQIWSITFERQHALAEDIYQRFALQIALISCAGLCSSFDYKWEFILMKMNLFKQTKDARSKQSSCFSCRPNPWRLCTRCASFFLKNRDPSKMNTVNYLALIYQTKWDQHENHVCRGIRRRLGHWGGFHVISVKCLYLTAVTVLGKLYVCSGLCGALRDYLPNSRVQSWPELYCWLTEDRRERLRNAQRQRRSM